MSPVRRRGVRRGLLLASAGIALSTTCAAIAQAQPSPMVQPLPRDDGSELRGYLTTLADNPRSLEALVGAGRAALRMGDADAALTFFGRADEVAPRDPRVKAGLAAAMVRLGQAETALSLLAEAASLGAPEAELAADRGFARDLMGDPRGAQRDYLLSLRNRESVELRRRLALSLAISGEREAALRVIAPQLRANDRSAWRVQAFVLALTGDAIGAQRAAAGVMPPAAASGMAPFFARLASLGPGQKARAVHLGSFPRDGAPREATASVSADPEALAFALGRPSGSVALASRVPPPPSRPARRRETADPGDPRGLRNAGRTERRDQVASTSPPIRAVEPRISARRIDPPPPPPASAPPPPATSVAPTENGLAERPVTAVAPPPAAPVAPQVRDGASTSTIAALPPPPIATVDPGASTPPPPASGPVEGTGTIASVPSSGSASTFVLEPGRPPTAGSEVNPASVLAGPPVLATPPSPVQPSPPPPSPESTAPSSSPAAPSGLADIAELVRSLPAETADPAPAMRAVPPPPPPPRTTSPAPARARPPASTARQPAARPAAVRPAHPSRHWVQIAGGANRATLPREFARLRALAPALLGRRTAYVTPLRATNRLLVGPFASEREAQAFVNQLAERDISAFAWTSPAGQEIETLPSAR